MKNVDKLMYIYKHRKIVRYLGAKYDGDAELLERLKWHDLDKMFMLLFYDKKMVSEIHRKSVPHHDNSLEKDYYDYVEMALDWESARYTKPDKPLNAYDTLYKYYPELEDKILPILKKFGIAESNLPMENDVVKYVDMLNTITEEKIKEELISYIKKL